MKLNFSTTTLVTVILFGTTVAGQQPLMKRVSARQANPSSEVEALISTVSIHTANINHTLSALPSVNVTSALNVTATANSSNPNVTAELNEIAEALGASAEEVASTKRSIPLFERADTIDCDATCQQAVYNGFGALSAEISYTIAGCIEKNAVDLSSSSSAVITVVSALSAVTDSYEDDSVGSLAGIVVQSLQAGLGTEIGGVLASIVAST